MLKFFIWYPVCIQPTLILPYTLSLLLLFSPKSCPTLCDPMDYSTPGLPVLLIVCSNSCPLSQWCYLTIPSSASPFSSYSQSFLASGSFPMSWLFASCGQSIEASASASVLPMNIQGWFPLGLTGWISMQPKGLSRVFSNTTVQKLSSLASSLLYGPTPASIHDYWENHIFDSTDLCWQSDMSAF